MEQNTPSSEPTQHIGIRISDVRRLTGVTQKELAERLGITKQAISKLEQTGQVDDKRLNKVANALGVSLEALKEFNNDHVFRTANGFYENYRETNNNDATNAANTYQFSIEKATKLFEELLKMEKRYIERAFIHNSKGLQDE